MNTTSTTIPSTAPPAAPTTAPSMVVGDMTGDLAWGDAMTWDEFELLVEATVKPFDGMFETRFFDYVHPPRLQTHWPSHQVKETPIRMSFTSWGDEDAPTLICAGGILNTARRWDYLASAVRDRFHVVCPDWPGRGLSGWLPTQGDYSVETNVEMILQLMRYLDIERATFIGASHGGTVCMALYGRRPEAMERLVLNDIGPYMAAERRARRAQAVARHYVFRRPADLFRRLGVSARNEGPLAEDALLHNTYFQTKWSDGHGGRVYRHDPRALQAYAEDARDTLDQWEIWDRLDVPVLVIRGMLSDSLTGDTVERMERKPGVTAMYVPDTGHMPALWSENQIRFISDWLDGTGPEGAFTCLNPVVGARNLFVAPTGSAGARP